MDTPSILIIDDEKSLRFSLAQILRKAGYSVETAGSGREGLSHLEHRNYQLVFLDMKMPGELGIDLVPSIRTACPDARILVLTAYPSMETAVPAIEMDVSDYLTKPVSPQKILEKVNSILETPVKHHTVINPQSPLPKGDGAVSTSRPIQTEYVNWVSPFIESDVVYTVNAPGLLIAGPISADVFTNMVKYQDKVVRLPHKVFWYLAVLMRHAPEPVPFVQMVYEAEGEGVTEQTAIQICRKQVSSIRKALDTKGARSSIIRLCRGEGYFLPSSEP